ncbi:hypothetical protein [Methylobacterium sp. ARG-1]|uniref:hypothetical protein n=1 Tax=Methylobacterium sp. ARG-1 TaxID=1692501 RepID=UPI001187409B|nr:hypothetical protein [Methylobacterium sp. ARG-1]
MNANRQSPSPGVVAPAAGATVPPGTGRLMPNKAMKHLSRFFALHAQQRVSVCNFFVILAGVISAAIVRALQAGRPLSVVVIALGPLPLLSFVFWRLDQRNPDLIKISERALPSGEMACLPDYALFRFREQVGRKRTLGGWLELADSGMAALESPWRRSSYSEINSSRAQQRNLSKRSSHSLRRQLQDGHIVRPR